MTDMPKWHAKLTKGQREQADRMLGQLFRMFDKVVTDVPNATDFEQCAVQLLAGTHMLHKMAKDICNHIGLEDISALSDKLSSLPDGGTNAFDDLPDEVKAEVHAEMAKRGVKPEDVNITVLEIGGSSSKQSADDDMFAGFTSETTGRSN
jgi:hypothetical protein